jgi:glycosyltransferase involved in cell wall biosynthesis
MTAASTTPQVSAIIPVYNGAAFLPAAVASVRAQAYPGVEIVIVDDGSSDDTAAVAADLRGDDVRYVRQEHRGLAAARNTGLGEARGAVITFHDVDDLWAEGRLVRQMGIFAADPFTEIVLGYLQHMQMVGRDGGEPRFEPHGDPVPALSMCCAAIRRGVFERVGRFDESQRLADDWDWFMRVREQGIAMTVHRDVVHYYRHHDANMTNDLETGRLDTLRMLKKSLDRRRAADGRVRALPALRDHDET